MALELLAPVGSPASLKAAVESGADSAYMGALWNARMRARNFSLEELGKAISYCHQNGVKVYVTLNIMIFESELPQVAEYIKKVYEYGADALIVQDLAVARLAREIAPEVEIHASTQMSVHNSRHAQLLKKLGFKRIVLARELSAEQVKRIKDTAGVEVEVFAHGALCYSYSGKCLFSFVQTGRSGNRGMCAQICRFPWKMYCNGKEVRKGYLTSTKDLNTISKIPQMMEAGIDCIKIEGRLRDAAYVRAVVSAYRRAINQGIVADLSKHTARGYTGGYLFADARENRLINPKAPVFSGEKIGVVEKTSLSGAVVRLSAKISVGESIRTARSGKIIEVFRLYQKDGKEIQAATGECMLRIKTLKPGDALFRVPRAVVEDEFLANAKPEFGKRKAREFRIPKAKSAPPASMKLFFPANNDEISKTPAGSVCIVPFEEDAAKAAQAAGVKFAIETPRIVFDSEMDAVRARMKEFERYAPVAFVVSEPSLVSDYPTIVSQYANVSNSISAAAWAGFGNVIGIISSIELPAERAKGLGFIPYDGKTIELMVSENDLFHDLDLSGREGCYLVDPRGNRFRVKTRYGRTVVEKTLK